MIQKRWVYVTPHIDKGTRISEEKLEMQMEPTANLNKLGNAVFENDCLMNTQCRKISFFS